jgi:hypothetical protein
MNIVGSQPMFLPWIGFFEQIKLADIFVHDDEVDLARASFTTRVQVKTGRGSVWLSEPIKHNHSPCLIKEAELIDDGHWRKKHLETLRHSYSRAKHFDIMFEIAKRIYEFPSDSLAKFNQNAIEIIADWLGLRTTFVHGAEVGIESRKSQRVLDFCLHFGAKRYITGHGALNYLDYSLFEKHNIEVCYMQYRKTPYPQLHGEFTPYVTILDAIANCGDDTSSLLTSDAVYWKDFLKGNDEALSGAA